MAPPLPHDLEDEQHRLARRLVARNSLIIGAALGFVLGAVFAELVL